MWRTPVFDRKSAAGQYFSPSLLNRIEGNTAHIAALLGVGLPTKTDWTATDFLTVSDMRRILRNVAVLRALYFVPQSCPPLPAFPATGWQAVNDLERNLHELYSLWRRNERYKLYAGESFAGEGEVI